MKILAEAWQDSGSYEIHSIIKNAKEKHRMTLTEMFILVLISGVLIAGLKLLADRSIPT